MRAEAELRSSINQKLTETGEKERYFASCMSQGARRNRDGRWVARSLMAPINTNRLKELLREKLLESGWREELKKHCSGAPCRSSGVQFLSAMICRGDQAEGSG